jgi:hypothetical protein
MIRVHPLPLFLQLVPSYEDWLSVVLVMQTSDICILCGRFVSIIIIYTYAYTFIDFIICIIIAFFVIHPVLDSLLWWYPFSPCRFGVFVLSQL